MNINVNSLSDLDEAAIALLDFAGTEKIFVFEGDMGAGKTTFIKALAKAFGVEELVSSPTFSIVNEYKGKGHTFYHFDFYRIKNLREAYDIGYEEYFFSGNTCFIEWPEKVEELLPKHYIKVQIKMLSENERTLSFNKI